MRAIRGARISMVMQDPKFSLNPVMTIGAQIAEALLTHQKLGARRHRAPRACHAGGGAHRRSRARREALPARGFGRHGPARHDRHDADPRAGPADRRRADLGARRVGAGAGARHHRRAGQAHRHGADLHQPRPQSGRRATATASWSCAAARWSRNARPASSAMPGTPTRAACWRRCRASTRRATNCRCSSAQGRAA